MHVKTLIYVGAVVCGLISPVASAQPVYQNPANETARRAFEERQEKEAARLLARPKPEEWLTEEWDQVEKDGRVVLVQRPRNRLIRAYAHYVVVKQCHEQRDGYVAVYINDIEMERAREAMGVLEKTVLAGDPSLPTAEMWAKVSSTVRVDFYKGHPWSQIRELCQTSLAAILRTVPPVPTAKDF